MGSADMAIGEFRESLAFDRREVRIHCRLTVQFSLTGVPNYGVCWNLGLHGMYVAYEGYVTQGEPIEISFVISEEDPTLIEAAGRVIWVNTGDCHLKKQMPEGFGVEFLDLSSDAVSAIARFIEGN